MSARLELQPGRFCLLLICGVGTLVVGFCGFAQAQSASHDSSNDRMVLKPFDYRGVTLKPGLLQHHFQRVRDQYLRLSNDDLLKGFRRRAGVASPGRPMGGWYDEDKFHVFGQILSGLSRMYAATGDERCRSKVATLTAEWIRCIEPDGFFYYSRHPNAPHYIYDKMVGGLVDAYVYCGNEQALQSLRRITDWAIEHLSRRRPYAYTDIKGDTEWYTLSENLYRAYLATGDEIYKRFAEVWEYREYWDLYARRADIFGVRPNGGRTTSYHAYSHVNTLGGAAAAYLVKGDPRDLDVLRNAFETLQKEQVFATGGYGPDESLLPRPQLLNKLIRSHAHFETQCGSWAAFKMSKALISLTGDAASGDWIERLVFNGLVASLPMTRDGHVFYYSDYNLGGASKQWHEDAWTCCAGTQPIVAADLHDVIYFHDDQNLYVNLFAASTVRWEQDDRIVTVTQQTRFPEEPSTTLTFALERPASFGLCLRTPGWLAGPMQVRLNGQPVEAKADGRHWLVMQRSWQHGDRLEVTLPMRFWLSSLDPDSRFPAAILRGPVAMALESPAGPPGPKIDFNKLDEAFVPDRQRPLYYRLASDASVRMRPFYSFEADQPYYLYLDPNMSRWASLLTIRFDPPWRSADHWWYSNREGSTATYTFSGTAIRWRGVYFDDAGRAEVLIDGKPVAVVDQYAPRSATPFVWEHRGLAPGEHSITIRVLGEKTPESRDRFVNIIGFEVIDTP